MGYSGNGLADAEQIDIDWRIEWKEAAWAESGAGDVFEAEVTDADAHPAMADTADNNMTDAEEFEIGTEPFEWDTAGDGIADGTTRIRWFTTGGLSISGGKIVQICLSRGTIVQRWR